MIRPPVNTEPLGSTESESGECVIAMPKDHRATDIMIETKKILKREISEGNILYFLTALSST